MTNQELLQIALQQSAIDCNCKPEDFLQNESRKKTMKRVNAIAS